MVGPLPAQCDVVVIGAGIGGLTAAALLAKAGCDVCVLERQDRPGGCLAGFRRNDFVFDTAIHWLNQCAPGGIVHRIFSHLDAGAPCAPLLDRIRRYKGESFDYLLTSNPDELKTRLIQDFPEDAKGIGRFFASAKVLGARMTDLSNHLRGRETFSVLDWMRTMVRLPIWGLPFFPYFRDKNCDTLARFFTNPKLRSIFCSEDNVLSVIVPIGWAYAGDFQKPPAGGSQVFPQWLMQLVRARGSRVELGAGVKEVLVDSRRAVGVRLEDGQEIRARWVIAAGDIHDLFAHMLPAGIVSPRRIAAYGAAEIYPSCVSVSLGLDCHPQLLGFGEEMVFLTRDCIAREAHNNGDPDTAGLSILTPSLRDPTLAPAGKGTLTIYASAALDYANRWKTGPGLTRGEAYRTFKQAYAQILLRRVAAAVAPNLAEHIEVLSIATPVTYLRYTGNRDGTIMGQQPSLRNIMRRLAGTRTPVKRLFVAGHWAQYGGGVPVAVCAGANAALLVLKEENIDFYHKLCRTMDGRS